MQKPCVSGEPPKATADPPCSGAHGSAVNTFLFYPLPERSADAVFGSGWPRLCSAVTCGLGLEAVEQRPAHVWLEQSVAEAVAFLACLCALF